MSASIKGAWVTHAGKRKPSNEDSVFFGPETLSGTVMEEPATVECANDEWLLGVADGVGGHEGGETASRICVDALAGAKGGTPATVKKMLEDLNQEIFDKSEERKLQGMGTTVAGLGFGSGLLFAYNVGDSRVYRHHAGRGLERITIDDSLVERGGKDSMPSPDAPSNVITQALGGRKSFKEINPNLYDDLDSSEKALYLVCSDGLNDMVEDVEIGKILAGNDEGAELHSIARDLLRLALDGGGKDNVSIVLAEYEPPAPKRGLLGRLFGRFKQ